MSLQQATAALQQVQRAIAALTSEAEQVFRPIGEMLTGSTMTLDRMGGDLRDLGSQLQSEQAARALDNLTQALAGTRTLVDSSRQSSGELLAELGRNTADVGKHLDSLRRIVGEITALAINGKIQSALVATAGVDFTVFTTEIGRLGLLANDQIEQACTRLAAVSSAIETANLAEAAFAREEATELLGVHNRIEANIAMLAERTRRAAQAIDAVEVKSRLVSEKVARTVGELQFNDITCQRIDHVRIAVGMLEGASDRVASATLTLQQQQLDAAANDYLRQVDGLIDNLRGLSADASDLMAEADSVFGDDQGGLFLRDIEKDVARAVTLLESYASAKSRTGEMVGAVSRGFQEMTKDLDHIRSIDADIRVMGLNATLKCGRLGSKGLALGVVAQELRACSRRTEDAARVVGNLLEKALASSQLLSADGGATDADQLSPARAMADSVADLSSVADAMSAAMGELRSEAPALAQSLGDCAKRITSHQLMRSEATRSIGLIDQALGYYGSAPDLDADERADVRRLVESLYTMNSERNIHQRFDGLPDLEDPVDTGASETVDDLFF